MRLSRGLGLAGTFVLLMASASAQEGGLSRLPLPDHANVRYGPDERNVLDLWISKSTRPTPLLIYYHGGGFFAGDKRSINVEFLRQLREKRISVAAANYRLSGTAVFPAQMHDCARALQYLRLHAASYNIDPTRIAASGGSAGAGISMWLAFHDDLKDPASLEPLRQQSTRLTAAVVYNAQSSYDPRFIKKLMNTNQVSPALLQFFGMASAADIDDPKFPPMFEEASAINHLSRDDPTVMVYYSQRNDPLPPNSSGQLHIHHPKFGFALKEKADRLGVECVLLLREQYPAGQPVDRWVKFLVDKFRPY